MQATKYSIPEEMIERKNQLIEICRKYPDNLPVDVCAKFIGMDKDKLRESIDQGRCKFAIGCNNGTNRNRFARIPTIAFFNWIAQGILFEE